MAGSSLAPAQTTSESADRYENWLVDVFVSLLIPAGHWPGTS